MLESKFGSTVLIDAHNSRYESAPKDELAGVSPHSKIEKDYSNAIRLLDGAKHKSSDLRAGFSCTELHSRLGRPLDVASGNLNVAVFAFNGFKYAMLQFNANNILPKLRDSILRHIRKKYGIEAELLTTDTHVVNSFSLKEDNELGKYTKYGNLEAAIDTTLEQALSGIEPLKAYHGVQVMENFTVWGPNTLEKLTEAVNSVFGILHFLLPLLIATGFIASAWVILLI